MILQVLDLNMTALCVDRGPVPIEEVVFVLVFFLVMSLTPSLPGIEKERQIFIQILP